MRTGVEMGGDAKELAKEYQHLAENPDAFRELCKKGTEQKIIPISHLAEIGGAHDKVLEEHQHNKTTIDELYTLQIAAHQNSLNVSEKYA